MWENYFIKKHGCERVRKEEDRGDFKKNGRYYEYKSSGYNQDNSVHMLQIRPWQDCDYIIQSITDDGATTFVLTHAEMMFEMKKLNASPAHGTKEVVADNEKIEYMMRLKEILRIGIDGLTTITKIMIFSIVKHIFYMQKIRIKNRMEIDKMKRSGQAAAKVLQAIAETIQPGITTYELELVSRKTISELNAKSSFLNYVIPDPPPYPATICVSVNDYVIHGIPNKMEILKEGDIIGVDSAVSVDGYHGDNAFTFPVGKVSTEAQKLLDVTKDSLYAAIAEAKPGNRLGDVSFQLQNVAEKAGFSVIDNFSGHGIGRHLHEEPQVLTTGKQGRGTRLRPGMVLAIEAMVNAGDSSVEIENDGWGVVTSDGSLSAFFEHTVAILSDGPEVLTESPIWRKI